MRFVTIAECDPLSAARILAPGERRRFAIEIVTAAVFGAVVMVVMQSATPWLPDNDSYYHVKMARLLPELGFVDRFPWLHWTIFRDDFVSHHHGFHALLAPFVSLSESLTGDLTMGGKVAAVIAMSCTAATFYLVLNRLGVPDAPIWLLALACAPWHFWLRMSYIRAPIIALPLMLLALWMILARRSIGLAIVAFLLTQVYNGSLLLLLISAAFVGGSLLRGESAREPLKWCAAVGAGVVLGFVIHPYFPANFGFLGTQLFGTGLGAPLEAGVEWRPFDGSFLLLMSMPLIVIWCACAIRRIRRGGTFSITSIALILLNLLFLALTLKARRFVEYWPVFAVISAAELASCSPIVPGVGRSAFSRGRSSWLSVMVIALLGCGGLFNLMHARANIRPSYDLGALREPMRILANTSRKGSMILTDDWDLFPYCFYLNHHNHYAVGLDPVFTMRPYPGLWERYRVITRGLAPAALSTSHEVESGTPITLDDIDRVFGADFVLVASDHPALYRQLLARPDRFRVVYPVGVEMNPKESPPFTVFGVVRENSAFSNPNHGP